jgi:HAD superfamily hydrolase (TIGR01509 family)
LTRVAGLIFDFDGLIVDSESPGYTAWSEVYQEYGCVLPFEKYSACIGTVNGFDLHGYLEQQSGRAIDRTALEEACTRRWLALMRHQSLLPGIADTVAEAQARGLKLAVASSSTHDWVSGNLRRFGLLERFDAICTRDDVSAVKPDPALYLLALERLGIGAQQAIAFEDSPNGILAAKRAGVYCIFVPNPLTAQLSGDLADERLESLEAFRFDRG